MDFTTYGQYDRCSFRMSSCLRGWLAVSPASDGPEGIGVGSPSVKGWGMNAHRPIRRWHKGQNSKVLSGFALVMAEAEALPTLRVLIPRVLNDGRGLDGTGVELRDTDA